MTSQDANTYSEEVDDAHDDHHNACADDQPPKCQPDRFR